MNVPPAAAIVLTAVIALAGCRGDDPDQAPPIGRAGGAPTSAVATPRVDDATMADAATAPAVVPTATPPVGAVDPVDRARRYRAAAEAARAALDTAWNRCGALAEADARRCRDAAVLDYDAAIGEARARHGDDAESAALDAPAGVLDRTTDLAMLQVTGTRG